MINKTMHQVRKHSQKRPIFAYYLSISTFITQAVSTDLEITQDTINLYLWKSSSLEAKRQALDVQHQKHTHSMTLNKGEDEDVG